LNLKKIPEAAPATTGESKGNDVLFSKFSSNVIVLYILDIAKSFIILDIKPWTSETDINAMEKAVRTIEADGLVWGQCKSIEQRIIYFD
jgi:elongation factor 1-beta